MSYIVLAEAEIIPAPAVVSMVVLVFGPVLLLIALVSLWSFCTRSLSSILWLILFLGGVALLLAYNLRWVSNAYSSA